MPELSIVIGFKDWGIEKLTGAILSLSEATKELDAEIIVSDYGSLISSRDAIEQTGAKYVYTHTDGIWSRSRALNAGLEVASGEILVTTDADMVFSPGTFGVIVERLRSDRNQFSLMQCRDLPEGITHDDVNRGLVSWDDLRRQSVFRPRWGMGGMIAVPRWAYERLRGLDERMVIYGGEDIDFALRMRRLGLRMSWIEDESAMMFHVWHPSSRTAADSTAEGKKAIATNRAIHVNDKSSIRNLTNWRFAPRNRAPIVSVVISTYNRSEYLEDCILSVLSQSMPDWELIIIDDGSVDDTAAVVGRFEDSRIRYFYQENRGLAAARNWGTDLARGTYVAVHDDDDLMMPWRLAESLAAITEGSSGSYGGWIDFSNETGVRVFNPGKRLSLESLLFNKGVYLHPTLLIETRLLKSIRYDEKLRSGSDYNLAIRLQRAGVILNHCGNYVTMRRQHQAQITNLDPGIQKTAGALTSVFGRSNMSWADVKKVREDRATLDKTAIRAQKSVEPEILEYLPDSTVTRKAVAFIGPDVELSPAVEAVLLNGSGISVSLSSGRTIARRVIFEDLSLHELLILRSAFFIDLYVETAIVFPESEMTLAPYNSIDESSGTFDSDSLLSAYIDSSFGGGGVRNFAVVYGQDPGAVDSAVSGEPGATVLDIVNETRAEGDVRVLCSIVALDGDVDCNRLIRRIFRSASDSVRVSIYSDEV